MEKIKTRLKGFFKNFISPIKSEEAFTKKGLFSMLCLASAVFATYFFFEGRFLDKHDASSFANTFLFFLYAICFLISRRTKTEKGLANLFTVFCLIQNCLLFPFAYFATGGITSGLPLMFMVGGIAVLLLLDHITMFIVFLLTCIAYALTYTIDWYMPQYVDHFTYLGDLTYLEIATTTLIVGLGTGILLRVIMHNFDDKHDKSNALLQQIEESSTKDPLTGAYNRRYLMNHIDKCIKKVESGEMRAFSILMFDIDHFKRVNDTYGHLAGDDCIKNLTVILKNTLRNVDVVSRYGGEEFICVLPTAEDTPAFRRAEQIRESVELTQLSEDIDKKITVSGGVAMYEPGMTPQQLIADADENLYIAKESGRNQIVWHKGGIPPLCYVAYDTTALKPIQNAGRRFSDATAEVDIQKI